MASLGNLTATLIPRIMVAAAAAEDDDPAAVFDAAVVVPGAAAGQNGGGGSISVPVSPRGEAAGEAVAGARAAAAAAAAAWSDARPVSEQLSSYPATCFLVAIFVTAFVVMSRRRVSAASMGSNYRHLLVRSEWWRVVTAAVAHGGLLHLAFTVACLWPCRRIEAELGSWPYLVASLHLLVLATVVEKMLMHVLLQTGRVADEASVGYSGVIFAWMVVLSLKPNPTVPVGGMVFGGLASILFNVVVVRLVIPQSSFVGNLAGVWTGLLFSTGALDFAREERYWGLGLAAWALAVFLGSLKATTTVPIPLIDYVNLSGRDDDIGVSVVPLDWSNREWLEDWAVANA